MGTTFPPEFLRYGKMIEQQNDCEKININHFSTTRSLRSLEDTESREYESYGGNCVHHWLDPFFISFTGKRLQSKQLRFQSLPCLFFSVPSVLSSEARRS